MSKLKTYRVSWETFRNGYHTFHIKEMTGQSAKDVRKAFESMYTDMAMEENSEFVGLVEAQKRRNCLGETNKQLEKERVQYA